MTINEYFCSKHVHLIALTQISEYQYQNESEIRSIWCNGTLRMQILEQSDRRNPLALYLAYSYIRYGFSCASKILGNEYTKAKAEKILGKNFCCLQIYTIL